MATPSTEGTANHLPSMISVQSAAHQARERIDMQVVAEVLVGIVAAIHVYIVILEMFLWKTPRGRKAFDLTAEFAEQTAALAAGLIWGLIASDPVGYAARVFFLVCVVIAGIYGTVTANRRILFIQALPAAIALILVILAHY
jgi:putative membrane protein